MLQILAPTDFSNNSYNALFYAARLFENKECTFHILNVYNEKVPSAKAKSEEGLDAIAHRLILDIDKNSKHELRKVSVYGNLIEGVSQLMSQQKVDFMVIGNKARDEVKDILFGNNAMQLVREVTKCSILIVPLEVDFGQVSRMAFISNYTNPIAKENIKTLEFIKSITESTLVPMSIEETKENKEVAENKSSFFTAFANDLAKEIEMPVLENKAKTILEFVDLWSIDMLCMVYYPHHFFLEFIGKGIIKELNTKLEVPFLILPNQAN
ncbi:MULTISPECIES: universal stress protein [Flavobacteriaceae]|uniref:universal stress protein n=1 Tax=Flavobacteriaceae TaxID=49546 RepID=UPI001490F596|nr:MULTISPECIES: universal stress protein [Allomuricauda]MDC6365942.1 universal stress protein [Muricauda sp. AC10]